ncbi:MAG: type I secretion system permease/ATPase [Sulfitobacter sp.]|nr:type I secretion system permease/ATPase [Sulfitobacter sp.]
MDAQKLREGRRELRRLSGSFRASFWVVACFSFVANVLMLSGPIYMLQVYDRVLSSGSVETLLALSLLLLFLYLIMGTLDVARSRILTRIAGQLERKLRQRVFEAILKRSALGPSERAAGSLEDLSALQRMVAAPAVGALFDLPWAPLFFAAIFIFHPLLGLLAVFGALCLAVITLANQLLSRRGQAQALRVGAKADALAAQLKVEAEVVQSLGMRRAAFGIWSSHRCDAQKGELRSAEVGAGFSAVTRSMRLALQSAILGLGAWLVLRGLMTPGGMIAGSVLMGRGLAPIETLLNQWSTLQRGLTGWRHLAELLGRVPDPGPRTALPKPRARLSAEGVTIVPPGESRAGLRGISFDLEPGQALGVIGPSGAGKSTLARALTGVWPPRAGTIKLDGAPISQYGAETLCRYIGYLPQRLQLFDGTLAQNIARLASDPDAERVVAAARMAGAHEMILDLPDGYDTPVVGGQVRLSGGQIQRIGLARALYDDPVLVVLDEPNSNLDNAGSVALNAAIRQLKDLGRAVLIMAHRPAAIQECEMLMVLDKGARAAFGPKDEVLAGMVRNVSALRGAPLKTAGAG